MSSKRALLSSTAAERTFLIYGGENHDVDNECIDARHTEGYQVAEEITMAKQKVTPIIVAALVSLCAGYETAIAATVPVVPDALKVSSSQKLSVEARGIGVQIYECRKNQTDPSKFRWVFTAPEAELFDSSDKRIGKHYAGPTWEANDGSKVVGAFEALYNGPDTNSIQWLLLKAKSNSGSGVFSHVERIQRVETVGGKAPTEGCGEEQAGKKIRVPYKAIYYFYGAEP